MESGQSRNQEGAEDAVERESADESSGWVSGFRLVSFLTVVSRALGMTRDILMAAAFGNGPIMDAFSVAFRIPNLARRLFGEGAMSTAFLPLYVKEHEENGADSGWKLMSTVLVALSGLLLLIVVVVEVSIAVLFIFLESGTDKDMLLILTAMMFPYLILICLAAQLSAVLHARGFFTKPALLPIVLNVVWIGTLVFIVPKLSTDIAKITAVALSILVGGLLQFLTPMPSLFSLGYRFRTDWSRHYETVKRLGMILFPVLLGLSITQINTVADSVIAWAFSASATGPATMSWLGGVDYPMESGTASALYFAQRMYQFPLGVFGVALGTVLFPLFSRQAATGRMADLAQSAGMGIRLILAIGIPASVGLILLAEPLTLLLFQHGAFTQQDAAQTSQMVVYYASGVWAFGGLLIAQRVFYSVGDTRTPLRIGLFAVGLNLLLNLTLIWPFGGRGLTIATSITATVQFAVTVVLIKRKIGTGERTGLMTTVWKTIFATVLMALTVWFALGMIPADASTSQRLYRVALPFVAAVAVFFVAARLIGLREPGILFQRNSDHPE